jgi:N-acetylmuramoyl-L-alanine amidase
VTEFMPRSAWTTAPRGGAQLTGAKLVGLACHWPGTTTDAYGVESESRVAARLRGWWDYHVNTRGWTDIGYNFAVDQAGRVWDLRGLVRVGAHCASASNPDANHEWVGVLFILGDREEPTAAMVRAFQDFRYLVFLPRWPGRTSLTGHGRAPGVPGAQTSCPGPYVAARLTDGTLGQRPGTSPPAPPDEEDEMIHIARYGSTRYRLFTDRVYAISEGTFRMFQQGGVPVRKYSNNTIAGLEIVLNGAEAEDDAAIAELDAKLDALGIKVDALAPPQPPTP